MKIATVTWNSHSSYGTYLQGYALQQFLKQCGYDNRIVSDIHIRQDPSKQQTEQLVRECGDGSELGGTRIEKLIRTMQNPGRLKRAILSRVAREKYERPFVASRQSFDKFRNEKLDLCEVDSRKELHLLNDEFDLFVCGSDQIWSLLHKEVDPFYFLDFAEKKKIAYAPSLGTDNISEAQAILLKKLLNNFSALSVREKTSATQLREITGKEVTWVVDPTLLLAPGGNNQSVPGENRQL